MQTPSQPPLSRFGRLADFFGLKRNLVILLIAIFVIGAGEELWMRFVPKYLQTVGATVFVIGLYDALRTLLGAIYAYPGGIFVDLWGHRRAFIIFNAVSIVGYALVLLVPQLGRGDRWHVSLPFMDLFFVARDVFANRSRARSKSPLHGCGYSIGDQATTHHDRANLRWDVDRSLRNHRVACASRLSYRSFSPQSRLSCNGNCARSRSRESSWRTERWNLWQSLRGFSSPMRRLLLSDILIRFCERIPYAWVVIFAMDYIGVSGEQVGVLTTIEMLAATLCIIPSSYYADRYKREPFVIVTFVMFTLFPICLLMSRSFSALVVAFGIRGLKEFGDTSRKALIIGYSEPERRGQMIGAYYLVRDLIVSAGAILGAYLWKLGPALNFLGAAAFGAAGTIFYMKTIRQSRQLALNDLKNQLEMRRTRWK